MTRDLVPVVCRGCGRVIGQALFRVSGWCDACRLEPPRPEPDPAPPLPSAELRRGGETPSSKRVAVDG